MTTLIVLVALPAAGYVGFKIMSRIDRFLDHKIWRS